MNIERLGAELRVRVFEIRAQDPERLGVRAVGLHEHGELRASAVLASRLGQTAKQRNAQGVRDVVLRAHASVERLPERNEADSQEQRDSECQSARASGTRCNLVGSLGTPKKLGSRALERGHRTQRLCILGEACIQGRVTATLPHELRHLRDDASVCTLDRVRLDATGVGDELPRVGSREARCDRRVSVHDTELEHVRVLERDDGGGSEKLVG